MGRRFIHSVLSRSNSLNSQKMQFYSPWRRRCAFLCQHSVGLGWFSSQSSASKCGVITTRNITSQGKPFPVVVKSTYCHRSTWRKECFTRQNASESRLWVFTPSITFRDSLRIQQTPSEQVANRHSEWCRNIAVATIWNYEWRVECNFD